MKFVSPAQRGHDVQVNVVDDPRARDPAQVPAEVVPLRRVDLGQRRQSALRQAVHVERLVVPKLGQLIRMAVRRDHQMPRRVRETVQQHERVIARWTTGPSATTATITAWHRCMSPPGLKWSVATD
jgi:hypothetical protein